MKIRWADNFYKRLKGLMFTKSISEDEGLLLKNCKQVHSFGMKYDIAVYYLDKNYKIIDYELLKRNKAGKKHKQTKHVLEVHPIYIEDKNRTKILIEELIKEVRLNG